MSSSKGNPDKPKSSALTPETISNRAPNRNKKTKDEIICLCNNVPKSVIEKCIVDGAKTMNEIFDTTTAGVGPCGGSCRRKLAPMLETYLETGKFPASPGGGKKK